METKKKHGAKEPVFQAFCDATCFMLGAVQFLNNLILHFCVSNLFHSVKVTELPTELLTRLIICNFVVC